MIYQLIIAHFLSDFVLQRDYVAKNKSTKWLCMAEHLLLIFLVFGGLAWYHDIALWIPAVYTLLHGIQDAFVWTWFKKYVRKREDCAVYTKYNMYANDNKFWNTIAVDQTIHLSLLIWLFSLPF